jgi:hypothetical protein
MTTRWKTCVAVIRTLATHRVPIDFLVYSLSLWELLKVVLWSKALGMSSAFCLVTVLSDLTQQLLARREPR